MYSTYEVDINFFGDNALDKMFSVSFQRLVSCMVGIAKMNAIYR
jgi:hypothetical protein